MNNKKNVQEVDYSNIESANTIIMIISYIGLFFSDFLGKNQFHDDNISILGWIILIFGAFIAFSPKFFSKDKEISKLVDDKIYGLIRHPQYTGGVIIAIAMCLITQVWPTYLVALIAVITTYLSMILIEERLINKFGDQYQEYMNKVPRSNIILGLIRKNNRDEL